MKTDQTGAAPTCNMSHGAETIVEREPEPRVTIARSTLRGALANAERAADALNDEIRKHEQQRDNFVRMAGAEQERLDQLRQHHSDQTRHVRNLLAAANQGNQP